MIKIVFKVIRILILTFWGLSYLAIATALFFLISYLFGHSILDGIVDNLPTGRLIGNDSTFALSLVYWFNRFFPSIPYWYPLQGMGVSLFHSYPMLTTFLILVLTQITQFSAVEIFKVLSFLTFPLTAVGIYILVWIRLRNQTIALISGIFFLLSQASWLFQVLHGIFAQSFSLIFVAPTIVFFELFIDKLQKQQKTGSFLSRLYLIITVIFLGSAFLTHVVTGTMISITLVMLGVLHFVLEGSLKPIQIFSKFIKGLGIGLLIVVLGQFLVAFWLLPFTNYTALANREGLNTLGLNQLQEVSLHLSSLLGIDTLGQGVYRYDFFFFAMPVIVFFILGTVLSFIIKNKLIQIYAISSLIFILLTTVPIYIPPLAALFKFFFTAVYFRSLIPALILVPVVAAWGVWSLPSALILIPFHYLTSKLTNVSKPLVVLQSVIGWLLAATINLVAIGILIWSVYNLAHKPPPNPEFKLSYKYQFQAYGPSLAPDFENFLNSPSSLIASPLKIQVSEDGLGGVTYLGNNLLKYLQTSETDITDASPFAAGGAIMQAVGIISDMRFINLYHYYASLIHGMWGYQAGVFYGSEKLYKSPNLLADLSDWFGIKYAILTPGFDPFEKYKAVGWEPLEEFNKFAREENPKTGKVNWGIEAWEYPKSIGLVSVSSRPVVLVITDFKKGGYDQVFRTANLGGLMYKDAWLVQGSKSIDDYSLDQLKQFDGVILHGYTYSSWGFNNGWKKIAAYLKQGGRVFVDTGWQYVSKDWGSGNGVLRQADVLPISKTNWDNIGTSWEGVQFDQSLKGFDATQFDPLVWDGNPWGMAVAQKSDLRNGAKALLFKENKVLMAERSVGKGTIVWSGMNIFSHVTTKMNEEEAKFLGDVLKPLFTTKTTQNLTKYTYNRPSPDKIEITFNDSFGSNTWVLFRESFSPHWRASINGAGLQIYPAGPGFLLVNIPKVNVSDKLVFEYTLGFWDGFFAKSLSVLTLILLVIYLIRGDWFIQRLPKININSGRSFIKEKLSSITKEEE